MLCLIGVHLSEMYYWGEKKVVWGHGRSAECELADNCKKGAEFKQTKLHTSPERSFSF